MDFVVEGVGCLGCDFDGGGVVLDDRVYEFENVIDLHLKTK